MKLAKYLLLPCAVALSTMLLPSTSFATPPIAKKEGNAKCVTCHTAAGKKELNKTGKCYKTSHSLSGCKSK
jgi:mono/diheme cytochrome c family protein